ncbi:MAG: ArnT family glycosyltransferase [Thermoplasmatota archaeon]
MPASALGGETIVERVALVVMALGAVLAFVAPAVMDLGYDGNAYVATGDGWARTHELVLAWGDVLTFGPSGPAPSHHFPPAYPVYLGLVFSFVGVGLVAAKWAGVAAFFLAVGVVYATTRDLYGRAAAAVVGALVAVDPFVFWVTGMGYSENLALVFFALTMWGIVKSLEDERFIVLAGLAAGLAYLSRAGMGAFFLVAGGAGLAWRLWHRGVARTATSVWYGLAVLSFALVFGLWAWRNVSTFGWPNWETSPGVRGLPDYIRAHPRVFLESLAARVPLLALVLAPILAFTWPEARRSLARLRDEHTSGLWLAVGLVYALGVFFSAAYLSLGLTRHEVFRLDTTRYALVAILPLGWALVRTARWDEARTRARWVALAVMLLVGCAYVAAFPAHNLGAEAARAIDPYVGPGDVLVLNGVGKYDVYAYLSDPADVHVYSEGGTPPDARPEFVITLQPQDEPGFVKVLEKREAHPWPGDDDYVAAWVRSDVVSARAVTPVAAHAGW